MAASSVVLSASAAVKSGPGLLYGVAVKGGSAATTAIVYDNTAGSGTKLVELVAAAGTSEVFTPCVPISAARGLYCSISGTAGMATVVYG